MALNPVPFLLQEVGGSPLRMRCSSRALILELVMPTGDVRQDHSSYMSLCRQCSHCRRLVAVWLLLGEAPPHGSCPEHEQLRHSKLFMACASPLIVLQNSS